jgi:phenylacetic acid degradation operon negative regulatory protein
VPSTALARFLRRELDSDPPRASSLIVTVWGDAIAPSRDDVWLSTLFRLLAPFGVNERAVRTGIYRLARSGWFEADAVGRRSRYRLTASGIEGFEQAFHRVYDLPFVRWDGRWQGVIVGMDAIGAAARKRVRAELSWAGFARFGPSTWLRPARRDGSLARIAGSLHISDAVTTFEAHDRAEGSLATLRSRTLDVWALGSLASDYQRFIARFGGVAAGVSKVDPDPEQAFVLRTLLIHAYRRVRLRDPQLPRNVLPADWPAARAYMLARKLHRITRSGATVFANAIFAAGEAPARRKPRQSPRFADPA